ncbi:thiamine phosphate synthase [Candidatus Enterococcus willemsii]|uniref:Thiamine-phosphate synthase n=1 Tax=Candidatus Enterococcus willemsii TaxID=1857215 RepID=A0ABQ6Z0B7_9ENTE|nr:thiamine phosphate synthase [Enterococcus sp. CU12B]KAF1304104.1 thiamine-phosphate diphosphorylase [Enterococcus sp. CU12B]
MNNPFTLYLVTHRYGTEEMFLQTIEQACQAGVTMVQLREKELSTRQFYELAQRVKQITDRYHIPLIINDRVDICLAVDAAGVHIGDDELPVATTRALIGDKILGVSAKTLGRAQEAQQQGADYLGVGAVFPTQTKATKRTPLNVLKEITEGVSIPTVAIGGITEGNLPSLAKSKVAGVAVVSEIMQAQSVKDKVTAMRNIIEQWRETDEK